MIEPRLCRIRSVARFCAVLDSQVGGRQSHKRCFTFFFSLESHSSLDHCPKGIFAIVIENVCGCQHRRRKYDIHQIVKLSFANAHPQYMIVLSPSLSLQIPIPDKPPTLFRSKLARLWPIAIRLLLFHPTQFNTPSVQ